MHLNDWMLVKGKKNADFAGDIGVSEQAVQRYRHDRIPKPAVMRRIYLASNGEVDPNGMYRLPELPTHGPAFQAGDHGRGQPGIPSSAAPAQSGDNGSRPAPSVCTEVADGVADNPKRSAPRLPLDEPEVAA